MKAFLREHRSRRFGYDAWAVRVKGAPQPFDWTPCTTREEARQLKRQLQREIGELLHRLEVVKVRITVTAIDQGDS